VKGGDVSYTLIRLSDGWTAEGIAKTTVTGYWSFQILLDNDESVYEIYIEVTDYTLTQQFEETFNLADCSESHIIPGPAPEPPPEHFDAWAYASEIEFSNDNPELGETITISGDVHANDSYYGLPVTWKATYVSADTVIIAPTTYYHMLGDLHTSTTFTPYVHGEITIEIVIGPNFSDADDSNNAATRVIQVGGPPEVTCPGDQTINEGDTFSGFGSFEDFSQDDTWTATVDYGDGSGAQPLVLRDKTFNLSHTYADNGVYTVTVTVTDNGGGVDSCTLTVTVNNVAPAVDAGEDQTTDEGSTVSFSGTFFDPGADTHTIQWDFGDSSTASGTLTPTHVYADNGVYTVTMTVTDDDGGVGTDRLLSR
jgi:PKD repeat protein